MSKSLSKLNFKYSAQPPLLMISILQIKQPNSEFMSIKLNWLPSLMVLIKDSTAEQENKLSIDI